MIKQFGTVLEEKIREMGLTKNEVSKKTGITTNILDLYLDNKVIPNDYGKKIAVKLGLSKKLYDTSMLAWKTGLPNKRQMDGNHKFLLEIEIEKRSKIITYAYIDKYGWFKNDYTNGIDTPINKVYLDLSTDDSTLKWISLDK